MNNSSCVGRVFLIAISFAVTVLGEDAPKLSASVTMPLYRVDAANFKASEADIRAVCDSAGRELWRYFPDYPLEPFVVTRGEQGPIVLFQRNERREIVMRLDTGEAYWAQYSYQFAHEFCHILCGFRVGENENRWFEETLCELASLYVMRGMAKTWKHDPPYAHWANYRDHLRDYADRVIREREQVQEIYRTGLPAFYRTHAAELRKTATNRNLNGAMAVVMLQLFEREPEHWEAVRWLNHTAAPAGETFEQYLTRWQAAAPEKHRSFIAEIAKLYDLKLAK
jgi:hypothetical protein